MSARLKFALFFKHHLHELSDAVRFMHLQRCALSLSLSKGHLEKASEDLAHAYAAYDKALAEYRLHQEVSAQSEAIRVVSTMRKEDLQWTIPETK